MILSFQDDREGRRRRKPDPDQRTFRLQRNSSREETRGLPMSAARCARPIGGSSTKTFPRKCSICSGSSDKGCDPCPGPPRVAERHERRASRLARVALGNHVHRAEDAPHPQPRPAAARHHRDLRLDRQRPREQRPARGADAWPRSRTRPSVSTSCLRRSMGTMRAASAAIAAAPPDSPICERVLARLAGLQIGAGPLRPLRARRRAALRHAGLRAALGRRPDPRGPGAGDQRPTATTLRSYPVRRRALGRGDRRISAARRLRDLTFIPGTRADFNLELTGGGRRMLLRDDYRPMPLRPDGQRRRRRSPIMPAAAAHPARRRADPRGRRAR